MKYYVIKTTKHGVEYKRYKCIEGWSQDKAICWQFSRQGAQKIADRLNELYSVPGEVHYNLVAVQQ